MDVSAPFFSYAAAQRPWAGHSSDSEFYSLSSPDAPSPDLSLPPSPPPWAPGPPGPRAAPSGPPGASVSPSSGEEQGGGKGRRRGRKAKNPSKQRQSASEKEKLRMRDLTKALHHLRSFLPPSVAPAGQTLTKIETLRLAIRYIGHLSQQLGLGEREPGDGSQASAPRSRVGPEGFCQHASATPGFWGHPQQGQGQGWGQGQGAGGRVEEPSPVPTCPSLDNGTQRSRFSTTLEVSLQDELLNSSLDSLLQSPPRAEITPSYQMYSREPCTLSSQVVPQEFWV